MILALSGWVSLVSFLLCMVYALYSYLSEAHLACDLDLTLCLQVTFFPIFCPLATDQILVILKVLSSDLGCSQSLSFGVFRVLYSALLGTEESPQMRRDVLGVLGGRCCG